MPRNLNYFGFARIEFGTPIAALRKLEASAVWGLEHVFVVLEEEQRQLRFLYVGQREFSLYLNSTRLARNSGAQRQRLWRVKESELP